MSAVPLDRDRGGLASSRPQAADLGTSVMGIPIARHIGYCRWAPRWWWRRIQPTSIVTEDAMIIAIMLSVAGLGFLCSLVFTLAVFALPCCAGRRSLRLSYGCGSNRWSRNRHSRGCDHAGRRPIRVCTRPVNDPENHDRSRIRAARCGHGLSPCAGNQHHRNAIRRVAARLCDDRRRGGRIDRVGAPCCPAVGAISRACCRVALAAGLRRR